VARLDGAGDVLLAGPAIRAVAARADRVTVVCGPSGAEAAALLPGVDRVRVFEAPWVALEPRPVDAAAIEAEVAAWRGDRFDGLLILTSAHQSPLPTALVAKLAGVAHVAAVSPDHPGSLLDVRLRANEGHEVERNLALAAAAGYPPVDGTALRVTVPAAGAAAAPAVPAGAVVVHPGASVPARGLPVGPTRDLLSALVGLGVPVVLTGSAAETAALRPDRSSPLVVDLGGRTGFAALARALADAAVLVVGNTGPAHLAAAVGTPVVSVFAPVVPHERWRPWGTAVTTLGDLTIGCAGCRARTCPFAGQPCLAGVDGAALLAAVRAHLPVPRPGPEVPAR
jgi:ADP-heptose:LPS heptosyltransferase